MERTTLEHTLIQAGQDVEPGYACPCCKTVMPAFCLATTVPDDATDHGFICGTCITDRERERLAALPPPAGLTDEDLNGLRAERLIRLTRTDWIELASSRARHGEAYVAAMDAYRVALHARFDRARDEQLFPSEADPWPVEPVSSEFGSEE